MADISIPFLAVTIINAPLLLLNMIVNTFYAFCLIFPPHNGKRKQPLTALLGFLVLCTIIYCVTLVMIGSYGVVNQNYQLYAVCSVIIYYFVHFSMGSYVWLNFYYFLQIVPSHFAVVQWVKSNIKVTIYVILVTDILVTMLSRLGTDILYVICVKYMKSNDFSLNGTTWKKMSEEYDSSYIISFYSIMVHLSVLSCVMVVSSLSTACYLYRHIKSVSKSSTSFSAKRLRAQIRVTVTGICQGVLFFLYASYFLLHLVSDEFAKSFTLYRGIFFTTTTLFISGTTVTLAIGQTAFRQTIVNMYKAIQSVGVCQKT